MAWIDQRDGEGMWWKLANRNKRNVVLDLKDAGDTTCCCGSSTMPHVLVENFRPGTLERLGLGPDVLLARNPGLVITRVSGFGQSGPYARRPGFATIAEAMSGFASINGEPDGQPLLPPIASTDEVTGIASAFATMVALHSGPGAGGRHQPAGDDVPADGPAAARVRAHRRAAAAARLRPPLHRCPAGPTGAPTGAGSRCLRAATPWRPGYSRCSVSGTTSGSRRSPGAGSTATTSSR